MAIIDLKIPRRRADVAHAQQGDEHKSDEGKQNENGTAHERTSLIQPSYAEA
jgi:hypothetical protein